MDKGGSTANGPSDSGGPRMMGPQPVKDVDAAMLGLENHWYWI